MAQRRCAGGGCGGWPVGQGRRCRLPVLPGHARQLHCSASREVGSAGASVPGITASNPQGLQPCHEGMPGKLQAMLQCHAVVLGFRAGSCTCVTSSHKSLAICQGALHSAGRGGALRGVGGRAALPLRPDNRRRSAAAAPHHRCRPAQGALCFRAQANISQSSVKFQYLSRPIQSDRTCLQ